jgi:Ubiquitin family
LEPCLDPHRFFDIVISSARTTIFDWVHGDDTVGSVKETIAGPAGIPAARQLLTYRGQVLDDNMATLNELCIPAGAGLAVFPLLLGA